MTPPSSPKWYKRPKLIIAGAIGAFLVVCLCALVAAALGGDSAKTAKLAEPTSTRTPKATNTPRATNTAKATNTPRLTATTTPKQEPATTSVPVVAETLIPATPTVIASSTPIPPASTPAALVSAYPVSRPVDLSTAKIVKVVDGDTADVMLDSKVTRLRLIGIDTPETVDPGEPVQCFGREASAKAKTLLDGQTVSLETDASQGQLDVYGRLLAYVWLPDGKLFNYEMIAQGFAHEYTYRLPYKYQVQFKQAARDAREGSAGLWSPTTCNGDTKQAADGQPAPTSTPRPAVTVIVQPIVTNTRQPIQDVGSYPCQPGQIKGNRNSGIYHAPGQRDYAKTQDNVQCFDTEAAAKAAGYRKAQR